MQSNILGFLDWEIQQLKSGQVDIHNIPDDCEGFPYIEPIVANFI